MGLVQSYFLPWRRVDFLATMKTLKALGGFWSVLGNRLREDPSYGLGRLDHKVIFPKVKCPRSQALR